MDMQRHYQAVHQLAAQLDPQAEEDVRSSPTPQAWVKIYRDRGTIRSDSEGKGTVWLMSLDKEQPASKGGNCLDMPNAYDAAELIIAGTHRLAQEHEIQAELARQGAERIRIVEIEAAKNDRMTPQQQAQAMENVVGKAVEAVAAAQKAIDPEALGHAIAAGLLAAQKQEPDKAGRKERNT